LMMKSISDFGCSRPERLARIKSTMRMVLFLS
jgi:hypothetical protein